LISPIDSNSDLDAASMNIYQQSQSMSTPQQVTKQFMAFFLKEILKNNFQPASGFDELLDKNSSFKMTSGLNDEMLIEKLSEELVDSQSFGFDRMFPSEITKYRKDINSQWQP